MRRVQISGATDGPELLGGTDDKPEPFVLCDDDFDRFERAARIKLTETARSSLQAACEKFLKYSRLAKTKPRITCRCFVTSRNMSRARERCSTIRITRPHRAAVPW